MVKTKDIKISTFEDAQNYYNKKFKKAGIADKFKLRCWLSFCRSNGATTFESYMASQSQHKLLDKLAIDLIDSSDIGTQEEIEQAIIESYNM